MITLEVFYSTYSWLSDQIYMSFKANLSFIISNLITLKHSGKLLTKQQRLDSELKVRHYK